MNNYYVCSNCGASCGQDARMGSLDVYLMCECASPKNTQWINDGRGGYPVYLNDAKPVLESEYRLVDYGTRDRREW